MMRVEHEPGDMRLQTTVVDAMWCMHGLPLCLSADTKPHDVIVVGLQIRRDVSSFGPTHYSGRAGNGVNIGLL